MEISALRFNVLHQHEERSGDHISRHESFSCDFLINEASLLEMLVMRDGGHSDFLGCFARGWERLNSISESALLLKSKLEQESGRVLLYLCPECGDIACGAYGANVSKNDEHYVWQNFAYENGYEEPRVIEGIGPFLFDKNAYESTIHLAAAL